MVITNVTLLQQSVDSILEMLQAFRVMATFSAIELDREPVNMERFEIGDAVLALRSEDGYTVFCRADDPADLDDRRQFAISDEQFAALTIEVS